jgi:16S rRNA processing protein RimM
VAEDRPPRYVKLGRVQGAAGLRGWLKVHSFTDPPENLLQHKVWELTDPDGRRTPYTVAEGAFDGRSIRVRLQGIEDRNAAELLRGRNVEVARSALPPNAESEYYRDDLIGFRVCTRAGAELGRVSHFVEAPAEPVMVVRGVREHWVPAVPRYLVRVDLGRGEIEVDWPEQL